MILVDSGVIVAATIADDSNHHVRHRTDASPHREVSSYEHRYDLGCLQRLCAESPWVPPGHEYLWARGLHGL